MALSRGVPKKIEYRDSDSILVRKEEFTYYRNLVYKAWLPYRNEIGPFIRIASPRLYYYLPYMSEHTVSDYAASGDGSHYDYTESAYYNEHRLPQTTRRQVVGRKEMTTYRYPFDINTTFYNAMTLSGHTAFPVEVRTFVGDCIVGSSLTTYKINPRNFDYVVDKVYTAKLTMPVSTTEFPAYNGLTVNALYGNADIQFGEYDSSSQPLSSRSRTDGNRKYYWTRGSQMSPAAIFDGVPWEHEIEVAVDRQDTTVVRLPENGSVNYSTTLITK